MKIKNIIDSNQFTKELLFDLFIRAEHFRKCPDKVLEGKILATLFFEPSTRTRLSFESAMTKLGGSVISVENATESSSAKKGESIEDTIRIVSKYSDIIVMRHFEKGASSRAAQVSSIPLINAGDGTGQHPTQALLDLYTIWRELQRLDMLKIAFVGDLLNGRTVKSLCNLLTNFNAIEITFVFPEGFGPENTLLNLLNEKGIPYIIENDFNKILGEVDIVYMTRIQNERIMKETYEKARGIYILNEDNLKLLKKRSLVMHPLPHQEEINLSFETEKKDKRIAYFRQAENGVYIRMALLDYFLN